MSEIQVFTPQCPQLPDGRLRHYFRKIAGVFRCCNCGELSR